MNTVDLLKRCDLKIVDTWDVTDLFTDIDQMKNQIKKTENSVDEFLNYQGKIFLSENKFKESLIDYFQILLDLENLETYVNLISDLDLANEANTKVKNFTEMKVNQLYSKLSFYLPELNENIEFIKKCQKKLKFANYQYFFFQLIEKNNHVLNKNEEKILADVDLTLDNFHTIFSTLTNVEFIYNDIEDSNKKKYQLNETLLQLYLVNPDRILRKNAFSNLYKNFDQYKYTLFDTFTGMLRAYNFIANTRNYQSVKERQLLENDVPETVFNNLIINVNNNLNLLHDYMDVRKDILQYEKLSNYDFYVPLISDLDVKYTLNDAKTIILDVFVNVDKEYSEVLEQALNERWIDYYPTENKRGGAYSSGTYKSKPYILLNYQEQTNDLFTLMHELGHSMHSYFTNSSNEYQNSHYTIFVAEIASTVNELLLTDYLLKNSQNEDQKKYLLNYLLEQFRTTVFRQTMFAEFEDHAHKNLESSDYSFSELTDYYINLNNKYFGKNVDNDQSIGLEWLRIPHFYSPFYVYQYATSFCAAITISQRIINEEGYFQKYLQFLRIGRQMSPLDSLQLCDIDFQTKDLYAIAFKKYSDTLDEFKSLMDNPLK